MQNKKISKYITEMAKIDQDLRFMAGKEKSLINFMIYAIDIIHNYRIKMIIEKYGYPMQKLIGKDAINSFWLLIQHQDYDLDLQENCLKYCDFEPKDYAHLTDRVLMNKGEKQIYGTQFKLISKGKITLYPVKDRKNVNKLRKQAGLENLEDHIKKYLKTTGLSYEE